MKLIYGLTLLCLINAAIYAGGGDSESVVLRQITNERGVLLYEAPLSKLLDAPGWDGVGPVVMDFSRAINLARKALEEENRKAAHELYKVDLSRIYHRALTDKWCYTIMFNYLDEKRVTDTVAVVILFDESVIFPQMTGGISGYQDQILNDK